MFGQLKLLSKCHIFNNMTFWPQISCYQGFFKKMAYFNVKCQSIYIMKIHKYEKTFVLKKSAHNIRQYGDKNTYIPLMMSSSYHTLLQ
jgi:hypothetical protein